MPRPLRGRLVELAIPDDPSQLAIELEELGYQRNAYLEEVVQNSVKFVRDEEQRLATSLATKPLPADLVVCQAYLDVQRQNSWLMIRRASEGWVLTAILVESR